MARLWAKLADAYPAQWAVYGLVGGQVFQTWLDAAQEFTEPQLWRGLQALQAEGSDYPPNLVKFLRMCRQAPVSYHQPIAPALPRPVARNRRIEWDGEAWELKTL